mmetsp:Transcript_98104/g.282216  ORF Transcript_98104/g.282216 Transcript_98104/m.282216 type:complete len:201 (-) Transcript_98104:249-851(-)
MVLPAAPSQVEQDHPEDKREQDEHQFAARPANEEEKPAASSSLERRLLLASDCRQELHALLGVHGRRPAAREARPRCCHGHGFGSLWRHGTVVGMLVVNLQVSGAMATLPSGHDGNHLVKCMDCLARRSELVVARRRADECLPPDRRQRRDGAVDPGSPCTDRSKQGFPALHRATTIMRAIGSLLCDPDCILRGDRGTSI